MATYDATIIQQFADRLYRQAQQVVAVSTVLGLIIGALIGYGLATAATENGGGGAGTWALVVALVGALIGYAQGTQKAFILKLQAQTALCQAQIEANTRAAKGAA